MAIVAVEQSGGGNFTPAPEGQFVAVCCDVVDLGIVKSEWEGEARQAHKIRVVFQIEENMDDGRPFTVSQMFTLSLNEKANLRKFLQQWMGRSFKMEELRDGFDVERLIGAAALVQLVQVQKGDKTYTNIQTIMKAPKGTPALIVRDYTRVQDRDEQSAPAYSAPHPAPTPAQSPAGPPAHVVEALDLPQALQDDPDNLPFK